MTRRKMSTKAALPDVSRHPAGSVADGRHRTAATSTVPLRPWAPPGTPAVGGLEPPAPARDNRSRLGGAVRRRQLTLILVGGDATVLALGAVAAMAIVGFFGRSGVAISLALALGTVLIGLWACRSQELWIPRVCSLRAIEISRVTRAGGLIGLALLIADRALPTRTSVGDLAVMTLVSWTALVSWRSVFRLWVTSQRRHGKHLRRLVIVGTSHRATELINVLRCHPEHGLSVAGIVGSAGEAARQGTSNLRIAGFSGAIEAIEHIDPDGVVIGTSHLDPEHLNQIIHRQHLADRSVMLDPGINRINFRSLQFSPLAYEPLLYVQKASLARIQHLMKRVFDAMSAALGLVVISPLVLVVALMIKVSDRGPVFFKQLRVGQDGKTFEVFKFRTMVVGAEDQLDALKAQNERHGPLFKLDNDPRATRLGRFLRDSSLDELPQLFNVLRGEMSIVGPRPALPAEVAEFPQDMRRRESVKPGITGLWQVDARDNPSFDSYRRLDLYYIENWSLTLDLVIVVGTVEQVLVRLISTCLRRRRARGSAKSSIPAPIAAPSSPGATGEGRVVRAGANLHTGV